MRLATLTLFIGCAALLAPVAQAQSVSGQAYGAWVQSPLGTQQSALAVLPEGTASDGAMVDDAADGMSVPGTLTTEALTGTTSGAIGDAAAAQSVATVFNVSLLNGLITASSLTATVSSTSDGAQATSNALGSTFGDLMVNGVQVTSGDGAIAPNTRMDLPGVGYVVLNEQLPTGDGVRSSGLTVNLIHVYLQSLTGGGCTVLGCVPGVLTPPPDPQALSESTAALLRELVAHLRQNRTQLREEWARRITRAQLLTAMTEEEIFAEATSVYDNYVEALETGTFEALQAYARNLSERIIPRGVETHEVVGIVLLLRDVLARSLFAKYHGDFDKLNRILDAYEPAANRIANTVAVGFVQERERIIRQQQEAIRELSTPVLQVRERLLILPIIGVIDPQRAYQLTEQLLVGIRTNRAKVVVMDITGVPAIDGSVANHLVQTVEAARLLGAAVIVTGLSPEIAQTLVTIGVELGKMTTVGDLQGGIEEAERLLGYKVVSLVEPS